MSDNKSDKAGRIKVSFYVPDYIFWKVEKLIGGGNVNALAKIFLLQFARGKAGISVQFEPTAEEMEKVKR